MRSYPSLLTLRKFKLILINFHSPFKTAVSCIHPTSNQLININYFKITYIIKLRFTVRQDKTHQKSVWSLNSQMTSFLLAYLFLFLNALDKLKTSFEDKILHTYTTASCISFILKVHSILWPVNETLFE